MVLDNSKNSTHSSAAFAFIKAIENQRSISTQKEIERDTEIQVKELVHHEKLIDKIEEIWERNETSNDKHRSRIITIIFILIGCEILIIGTAIFMSPFYSFPDYIIPTFSTAVVIQTFGLVMVVLKYLFNNKDDKFLEAISSIYKSNL